MPCFSTGPQPGTPEYTQWAPEVRRKLNSFTHVVDYYYAKAGLPMPHPHTVDGLRDWADGQWLPADAVRSVDHDENQRVLRQILLHLDCDGIDVFHLNDIMILLFHERTPKNLGYLFVLEHCFIALRNHAV